MQMINRRERAADKDSARAKLFSALPSDSEGLPPPSLREASPRRIAPVGRSKA